MNVTTFIEDVRDGRVNIQTFPLHGDDKDSTWLGAVAWRYKDGSEISMQITIDEPDWEASVQQFINDLTHLRDMLKEKEV